jgi:hypothetical protein
MELRAVIARIVTEFDVALAPGEDGKDLIEKSKVVFTTELAPLGLVLTKRGWPQCRILLCFRTTTREGENMCKE